jgi:hypothetical protein
LRHTRIWMALIIPLLLLTGCGLPSASATSAAPSSAKPSTMPSYNISEALAQGLITVEINGFVGTAFLGASSGDVIKMSLQRQKPETMKIIVPLGTVLVNNDAKHQDMVIMRLKGQNPSVIGYYATQEIVLYGDAGQEYLFEAYCRDMDKDNIHSSSTFALGAPAAAEIVTVLTAAAGLSTETSTFGAVQVALWAITADPTRAEVTKRFEVDELAMAGAWTILEKAGINPVSKKLFAGYTPTPAATSAR